MNTNDENIKQIILPSEKKENNKSVKTQKEKNKRQITTTRKWTFTKHELSFDFQWDIMNQIYNNNFVNKKECDFVLQQIKNKIYSYKTQDIDKKLFNQKEFIVLNKIIELMIQCNNKCYYCNENVNVLYEYVRESKQWTLDRLDNNYGHNNDNVVIACLSCNLRRKTMYHERFLFTKQLTITKI